jgi:sigma-B regulation protein RsbU (phosphoserine phosphatase)
MGNARTQRLLELRFPARADQLCDVRDAVRECVTSNGADAECACDIVMAVDEACQNIIRHGYAGEPEGGIELEIERRDDDLVFSLRDFAPKIDPACVKPRELDDVRPGGLGTHLIRTVMDEAEFVETDAERGNLLRMVKRVR